MSDDDVWVGERKGWVYRWGLARWAYAYTDQQWSFYPGAIHSGRVYWTRRKAAAALAERMSA